MSKANRPTNLLPLGTLALLFLAATVAPLAAQDTTGILAPPSMGTGTAVTPRAAAPSPAQPVPGQRAGRRGDCRGDPAVAGRRPRPRPGAQPGSHRRRPRRQVGG